MGLQRTWHRVRQWALAPWAPSVVPPEEHPTAHAHPHPSRMVLDWTPESVRSAVLQADGGNLSRLADLYSAIRRDPRVSGVMATRTLGQIALPLVIDGDRVRPRQYVEAHWWEAFEEQELARLLDWGLGLGVALGQLCWAHPAEDSDPETWDTVPRLRVWDPRWVRYDYSRLDAPPRVYVQTAEGCEVEVHPGDGEWILYTPYGEWMPWRYGLVNALAFPWLLKMFALHDRARHSEVAGSPAWIGETTGLSERQRQRFLADLVSMGRNARVVLPEGCKLSMLEATGRTWEIYSQAIDWADREMTIAIAGQYVTTEGTSGFAEGDIHERVLHSFIRAAGETLATCLHTQAIRPWVQRVFGGGADIPWPRWRTEPPEDLQRKAASLQSLGQALMALDQAIAPSHLRVDVRALVEQYQIPVTRLAPASGLIGPRAAPPASPGGGRAALSLVTCSARSPIVRTLATQLDLAPKTWRSKRGSLPTEFRLFAFGENDSDKGPAYLTPESAHAALEARAGRDVMIDLEHLSLDSTSSAFNPDAVGWGRLEVREDGLYLTDVRWTPDGEARLRERRQRYISPAFRTTEDGTIVEIVNVALTALPAMHDAPPLIAASSRQWAAPGAGTMTIADILAMLGLPPETTLDQVAAKLAELQTVVAAAAEAANAPGTADALDEAAQAAQEAADLAAEEAPMASAAAAGAGASGGEAAPPSGETPPAQETIAASARKGNMDVITKLAARVNALEAEREAEKRAAMLRQYSNRLTPAMREALKCADTKTLSTVLPALPVINQGDTQRPRTAGGNAAPAVTPELAAVAKLTRRDATKDLAAYTARTAEGGAK